MTKNARTVDSHAFWRLKRLREIKGLTLEHLGARTGLTKSYLSKVERGVSVPSIATALKLADAFEVGVGELFGVRKPDKDFVVVRKAERKPFSRKGGSGGYREAIAPGQAHGLFEAFIVHPPFEEPPGYKKKQHPGHELYFVLSGKIELAFPHSSVMLSAGDCVLLSGRLPHRGLSVGPQRAEALVVIVSDQEEADKIARR